MNPADLSASALLDAYRSKSLSPVDTLRSLFQRLEVLEARVNAFRLIDYEGAWAQARASEARWLRGGPVGALDGVPVALKDLLDVRGLPTRRGSLATPDSPASQDSPAAARLREAGAILFGKTNTPEFGWKNVTHSELAGVTRNPWNPNYTPGGSSGGAAAAAALNLGPLHVGTDGGGSIRVPASATGVFGLKPSYGRVPCYPPAFNNSLFHIGPITRSVADAALLLNVIATYDPRDFYALPQERSDFRVGLDEGVRGLRVAYAPSLGSATAAPSLLALAAQAVNLFVELGAHVEEVRPDFPDPSPVLEASAAERAIRLRREVSPERYPLVDPEIRSAVERTQDKLLSDYIAAADQRALLTTFWRRFHEKHELLLTPALGSPVPRLGEALHNPFSSLFNVTQQPAASVPIGFDEHGMPVGLQIVATSFRDDLVLRAARAYESAQPFRYPSTAPST